MTLKKCLPTSVREIKSILHTAAITALQSLLPLCGRTIPSCTCVYTHRHVYTYIPLYSRRPRGATGVGYTVSNTGAPCPSVICAIGSWLYAYSWLYTPMHMQGMLKFWCLLQSTWQCLTWDTSTIDLAKNQSFPGCGLDWPFPDLFMVDNTELFWPFSWLNKVNFPCLLLWLNRVIEM